MTESEKQQLMITLKWIVAQNPDPKRSQIHGYLPHIEDPNDLLICDDSAPFYLNKYQTVYYDSLAESILERLNEGYDPDDLWTRKEWYDIETYATLINFMYEDIKQGFWGYVCDW